MIPVVIRNSVAVFVSRLVASTEDAGIRLRKEVLPWASIVSMGQARERVGRTW